MTKSLTSFFNSTVSDEFLNRWATFVGVSTNDPLAIATAQIIAAHHDLTKEFESTVENAVAVSDQQMESYSKSVSALAAAIELLGKVINSYDDILQKVKNLNIYCEKLESNSQQMLGAWNQSQRLYQDSLLQNQQLQDSYKTTQQLNQKLIEQLEKFQNTHYSKVEIDDKFKANSHNNFDTSGSEFGVHPLCPF